MPGKAYTYVNSTIKNSINNSINQGLLSHDHMNNHFAINNFVGEDDSGSHNQLSPEDKHKVTTGNPSSIYSFSQEQRKQQHLKRGKIETRVKSSNVNTGKTQTNPTNHSVASGGALPNQSSNQNI